MFNFIGLTSNILTKTVWTLILYIAKHQTLLCLALIRKFLLSL
jgi:hypothetical protein